MRLPRVRFTVRGMMAIVAIVGLNLSAAMCVWRTWPVQTNSIRMGYWHLEGYSDGSGWVTTLDGTISRTRGPSREWTAQAIRTAGAVAVAGVADGVVIVLAARSARARRVSGSGPRDPGLCG